MRAFRPGTWCFSSLSVLYNNANKHIDAFVILLQWQTHQGVCVVVSCFCTCKNLSRAYGTPQQKSLEPEGSVERVFYMEWRDEHQDVTG